MTRDINLMLDAVLMAEPALVFVAVLFFILRPAYAPQALLLAMAPWAVRLLRENHLTRFTLFDVHLALFLVSAVIGLWAAYDHGAARNKFWLIVGGILLFHAILNGRQRLRNRLFSSRSSNWVLLFSLLGACLSLYFVTQNDFALGANKFAPITALGVWIHAHVAQLGGETFHPNIVGGILAVILPLNVAGVWYWPREAYHGSRPKSNYLASFVSLVTATIIAFGLVMTQSRGAWLALTIATMAWGLARMRLRWERLGDVLAITALLVAGILLIVRPSGSSEALDHLIGSIPAGDTATNRLTLYQDSLQLLEETVYTGGGLGSFPMRYSTYALDIPVIKLPHAHNLYLDIWLEQGLAGIVGFMGMIAVAVWVLGNRRTHVSVYFSGAVVALGTMLIHGLMDDVLYASRALPILFVPFALIMRHSLVRDHSRQKQAIPWFHRLFRTRAWGIATGAILLFVILAGALFRTPAEAAWHADLGTVFQMQAELRDWPAVQAKEVRRNGDLSPAIHEFERALALVPDNRTANRRLGLISLEREDYTTATHTLERAYRADPEDRLVRQSLALAYVANGQVPEAIPLLRALPDAVTLLAEQGARWQKEGHAALSTRANTASMALLERREVTFTSRFDGTPQKYLLVFPQQWNREPPPLVVYLHSLGNDPFEYLRLHTGTGYAENLAVYLSRRGVVAIAPTYRGDSWGNDVAVADVTQIIRHVQAEYGNGPVILAGLSMGATAALSYAVLAPRDIPVHGIVVALGSPDLEQLWEEGGLRGSIATALGGTPQEVQAVYRSRSVLRHPERIRPDVVVAILSAKSDTVIPPHHQEALRDVLRARGMPVLFLSSGGGHSPEGLHFRQAFDFVLDR